MTEAIGQFGVKFLAVMRTQLKAKNTLSRGVFVCNSMEDELMSLWKIKIMFVVYATKYFELHYAIKVSLQNQYLFLFTANLSAEKNVQYLKYAFAFLCCIFLIFHLNLP